MVATYTTGLCTTVGDLASAIEAVQVNQAIQVVPFMQDGRQKFLLIKGATSSPA